MRRIGLALLVLLMPSLASAATYYVRTDGNNANWPCTANTAVGACLTIDYVADRVSAGDTVRVQAGQYAERVTPGVNGTDGNPITFVADGVATACGFTFSANSYLRVIGMVLDGNAGCTVPISVVSIGGGANHHLEFWHNTLRDAVETGFVTGYGTTDRVHQSIFLGNTCVSLGHGFGSEGSGICARIRGNHNVVAYSDVSDIYPDGFYVFGTDNRFLNTYAHGLISGAAHSDVFQTGGDAAGFSRNLFEATLQIGGAQDQEHTTNWSNVDDASARSNNILRRNVWHNVGEYAVGINQNSAAAIATTRYYHNTTASVRTYSTQITVGYGAAEWQGPNLPGGSILNNIEYDSWGSAVTNASVYYVDGALTIDYNLGYDSTGSQTFASPWTTQAHPQSNINPYLVDYANDNFTIGASSGAIGTAGPLTTTSGSGTGTTFNVEAGGGGFFVGSNAANLTQYGGALAPGDTITVGTDVVTVVSVSGDAITVTPSFTWANAEPVYFGNDTTPDIGAYPYKAGGYALSATYATAGSTVTLTPNDASLVRWVVCYADGVPYAADASSPYTCATATGTFSARVYPLFASATLYATATPGGVAPAAPTGVRIR